MSHFKILVISILAIGRAAHAQDLYSLLNHPGDTKFKDAAPLVIIGQQMGDYAAVDNKSRAGKVHVKGRIINNDPRPAQELTIYGEIKFVGSNNGVHDLPLFLPNSRLVICADQVENQDRLMSRGIGRLPVGIFYPLEVSENEAQQLRTAIENWLQFEHDPAKVPNDTTLNQWLSSRNPYLASLAMTQITIRGSSDSRVKLANSVASGALRRDDSLLWFMYLMRCHYSERERAQIRTDELAATLTEHLRHCVDRIRGGICETERKKSVQEPN